MDADFDPYLQELDRRRLPDGGFAGRPGHSYRADATAWAALAMRPVSGLAQARQGALRRLRSTQRLDGRVTVTPEHPEAWWPTPLAVLAWWGTAAHDEARNRATTFLLRTSGVHWARSPDSPMAHDTALRGWSWTSATHSWVEPTGLAILALRATGHERHRRVTEGITMLLDRMLSRGGWNYGNTLVFDRELLPSPESTGIALAALAGRVPAARVEPSLAYLESRLAALRTPLSLGWSVLALEAWGRRPDAAAHWILDSLARPTAAGPHDTAHLALLLVAAQPGELLARFEQA